MIISSRSLRFATIVAIVAPLFQAIPSSAQQESVPDDPTLTVRIVPPKPYLQEEIVQVVRLIAPHPFEELVLDLPPIADAETITLQQPKNRKFQTYGGEGYIYETSRAIFPKKSGELRIPPVRISGSVGISRDEREPFALKSETTILDVRPPPDDFSTDWWLVARDVKIDESWSQPVDDIRVGDQVTRSITVTVAGATGAHLPELEQGRSNGLTVLPGRTERSTEITPGGVIGKISRSFEIKVEQDQPINISPVRVVWWNTSTEIERRSAAPAMRLEPLPRDVERLVTDLMAEASTAHDESRNAIVILVLGCAGVITASCVWLLRSNQKTRPEDRRLRKQLSHEAGPIDALRALKDWTEATYPYERPMTFERLGEKLGPIARRNIERLQRDAFGDQEGTINAAELVLEIVDIAQTDRHATIGDSLRSSIDRLLGPNQNLPDIEGRSIQKSS